MFNASQFFNDAVLARHLRKGMVVKTTTDEVVTLASDYRRLEHRLVETKAGLGRIWTADIVAVKDGKKWHSVYVPAKLVKAAKAGKLPPVASTQEKPKASAPKGKGKGKAKPRPDAKKPEASDLAGRLDRLENAVISLLEKLEA